MGSDDSFENRLKALADQLARSLSETDVDDVAEKFGVDPDRVRGLTGAVERWLSDRGTEGEPLFGDRPAGRPQDPRAERPAEPVREHVTGQPPVPPVTPTPSSSPGPHPLDLPTDPQGIALSALDSGRWTVRPGSSRLTTTGADGAGTVPAGEASDLVNELRARDWITADGAVTLVGRQALMRWTRAADPAD
jgi:hypothetical protein